MSTSGLNRTGHMYECLTQTGPDAQICRTCPAGLDRTGTKPIQVEVAPSLVTDCKKPLHQNRWFWGLGIGFFKSERI